MCSPSLARIQFCIFCTSQLALLYGLEVVSSLAGIQFLYFLYFAAWFIVWFRSCVSLLYTSSRWFFCLWQAQIGMLMAALGAASRGALPSQQSEQVASMPQLEDAVVAKEEIVSPLASRAAKVFLYCSILSLDKYELACLAELLMRNNWYHP